MATYTRRFTLRSLGMVMAGAGTLALAAGCQRGGAAGGQGTVGALSGRLTFWAINAPWGQMAQGVGGDQMAAFRARHPGLQIEIEDVVPGGPASVEKLYTAAAAGTLPDLYMANRGYASQLGAEGLSRALDEFLKRSRALPRQDLWESHLADASWKGQTFAITHSSGVWVLFLNKQLWQQAGLNPERPPKTWDELEDVARRTARIAGGVPERVGYHPTWGSAGPSFWLVHYRQMGGDYFTKDWQPAFANDERAIQTLTWMKGFVDRQGGFTALEEFRTQVQVPGGAGIFGSGRIATLINTHTTITDLERTAPNVPFSVAALPLPARGRQSGWQGGGDLHISKETKVADTAWTVIEHIMAPENILAFSLALSRIPSRKSVGQGKEYLDKSPHHRAFIDMVPHSSNVPPVPGNADLAPIIAGFAVDVIAGRKGIREALQEAAQKTTVVMEKWRRFYV